MGSRKRLRPLVLLLAIALVAMATTGIGRAASTPNDDVGTTDMARADADSSYTVALVTGDVLTIERAADRWAVAIDPAERSSAASFDSFEVGDDLYVVPSDVLPLLDVILDRELFNISKLVTQHDVLEVDDSRPGAMRPAGTRAIVRYRGPSTLGRADASPGLSAADHLASIDAVVVTVDADGEWWDQVAPTPSDAGDFRTFDIATLGGIEQVWLDEPVEVSLAESVPQIGAPAAWDLGYDGTGTTVAVLDTGIDADHPDLAGSVVASENFTFSPSADDVHGHGTHVAGIVAGSGAASDGALVGAAPGAQLMNGKVLSDTGFGLNSWIIAGMEWAAQEGADIVNLSLGGAATDGTDPLSLSLDSLTAAHDVLFVAAAGNSGHLGDSTVETPGAASAALTVGSVDKGDELAATSGRGPRFGDLAIKPDVTAPGVGIVSARAAGTERGEPVNDNYTRLSGTSMAAPHVAAAAAILLQRDPDLAAGDLKAILTTTAIPADGLDVYEQGGGRIDVQAALDAPIRATPTPLDLGFFPYPHDDADPVSAEVTYTNLTDEPIILDLDLAVASRDGDVPLDAMLSVAPSTLMLDPGAAQTAEITLDVRTGEFGLYGGYLVASSGDDVASRTPLGFYKQSTRYDLTVEGITRDGLPATSRANVDVANVDDVNAFSAALVTLADGSATFRVPPGTYSIAGFLPSLIELSNQSQDVPILIEPEVEVDGDTHVLLDARDATLITVETPEHDSQQRGGQLAGYRRVGAIGASARTQLQTGPRRPYYALATEALTVGDLEFFTRWHLMAPEVTLDVIDPTTLALDPNRMLGSPVIEGDVELPVVDAGFGRVEDFDGVDAEGAIVLTRHGEVTSTVKRTNAAAAGGAALLVANSVPGPFVDTSGVSGIPTMTVPMEDGDALQALLAESDVTVRMQGNPGSSFLYDLMLIEHDQIPADLDYVAHPDDLATVANRFHADVFEHTGAEFRASWRPWQVTALSAIRPTPVGVPRTEYLTGGDTRYRQTVYAMTPSVAGLSEPLTTYTAGESREQTWFKQVTAPGVTEGSPHEDGVPVVRVGDTLELAMPEWTDAHRGHRGVLVSGIDTVAFRLFEDGQLIAEAPRPRGEFAVGPQPAEYRLEVDVARDAPWWTTSTQTRTAWTLPSARPSGDGPEPVAILLIDYDLDLDLLNTAPHPRDRQGPPVVTLGLRQQPGAQEAPIAGARLWTSYDDGATWRERTGRSVGGGRFEFRLDQRDPEETSGYVSLRVDGWDTAGSRVEQEIIRAYALPPR